MQLIIHGTKHNRYSINALLGALETKGMLPSLPVVLTDTAAALWKAVRQLDEEAVIAAPFSAHNWRRRRGCLVKCELFPDSG